VQLKDRCVTRDCQTLAEVVVSVLRHKHRNMLLMAELAEVWKIDMDHGVTCKMHRNASGGVLKLGVSSGDMGIAWGVWESVQRGHRDARDCGKNGEIM
jgi:hypothetical protein